MADRGGLRASWGNTGNGAAKERSFAAYDGGGGGGMEARIAKLEADMDHVKRDIAEVRTDTRDVRERLIKVEVNISHLPSKAFVFGAYGTVSTLLAAIILFQDQLRQLLGVAHP